MARMRAFASVALALCVLGIWVSHWWVLSRKTDRRACGFVAAFMTRQRWWFGVMACGAGAALVLALAGARSRQVRALKRLALAVCGVALAVNCAHAWGFADYFAGPNAKVRIREYTNCYQNARSLYRLAQADIAIELMTLYGVLIAAVVYALRLCLTDAEPRRRRATATVDDDASDRIAKAIAQLQTPGATPADDAKASLAIGDESLFEAGSVESVMALVTRMQHKYAPKRSAAAADAAAADADADADADAQYHDWSAGAGEGVHWKRLQSQWKAWDWSPHALQTLIVNAGKEMAVGRAHTPAADSVTLSGVQVFVDGVALTFTVVSDSYAAYLHALQRVLRKSAAYQLQHQNDPKKQLKELFVFCRSDFAARLYGTIDPHKHCVLVERKANKQKQTQTQAQSASASPAPK